MNELELERRLTGATSEIKELWARLKRLESQQENINELVSTVATLANEMGHVKGDVEEIKGNVQSLLDRPGKRWNAIVDKLIWAVLAALVGFGLAQIGL